MADANLTYETLRYTVSKEAIQIWSASVDDYIEISYGLCQELLSHTSEESLLETGIVELL